MVSGTITTVHSKDGSIGRCLEMVESYNGTAPFNAKQEAAEVLDVLLELPVETRRELARMIAENGDTFVDAPRPAMPSHEPVKGTGSRRRRA